MNNKTLAARCSMCPSATNRFDCSLIKPDLISGEPTPCRFVRVFTDGAKAFRVLQCKYRRVLFKAHYLLDGDWVPYRTKFLPCRNSFDRAQSDLNLYASRKGWTPVWPVEGGTGDGR